MRRLLFCFCLFSPASSFAQGSKFLIGVNGAAVWNSYLLGNKNSTPYLFQGRVNGSLGIQSLYSLGKRYQLDARLNFATKNFGSGIDLSYLKIINPNDPVFTSTSGKINWDVRQVYLEIPISLNYAFTTDKPVKVFGSLGITNSFLLSAKYANGRSVFGSGEVVEKYKNYLISVKTGLGILFPMGKDFQGTAECIGNIYPEKVYNGTYIKENPFQLALAFGVLKKI